MNKEELVQEISKKSKVTQKEANVVLSAINESVYKTVYNGKKVSILDLPTYIQKKIQYKPRYLKLKHYITKD